MLFPDNSLPSIHCGESIKVPLLNGIFGFKLHLVVQFCNQEFPGMFSVFAQNEILYNVDVKYVISRFLERKHLLQTIFIMHLLY